MNRNTFELNSGCATDAFNGRRLAFTAAINVLEVGFDLVFRQFQLNADASDSVFVKGFSRLQFQFNKPLSHRMQHI